MSQMSGRRAYFLAKQYADIVSTKIAKQGFKVQVEEDRSILETTGQEKVFYFLPKDSAKPQDGYDEFIWTDDDGWEQVGVTDVDLSDAEMVTNKVTSLSAQSTDTQYPSAKCLYDIVGDLSVIDENEVEESDAK